MGAIFGLISTPFRRWIAGGLGFLALFVAYTLDQRSKGAEGAINEVRKNNAAVSEKAGSASRKSLSPYARGMQLPYYRAD